MKKNLLKTILLALFSVQLFAQTEQANHEKYWNFREKFKRHYLKIGNLDNIGNPLFGTSIPIENRDTVNTGCGGSGKRMRWGDATLHQGYYIAMLATEFELLRRAGSNYTVSLNELYYAITAVNRLDEYAESYLNYPNGSLLPNKNGFFLRDDVPGNFNSYFQDPPPDNITCISSDRYDSENGNFNTNFQNAMNEMSQDQIYGLFMGFAFVKKFIPPGLMVQPTPQDTPMDLVYEAGQITDRIMNYITQQWTETVPYPANTGCNGINFTVYKNWMIKNPITGVNVGRGADMFAFSAYAADLANVINGQSYQANFSFGIDFPGTFPLCLTGPSTNPSISIPLSDIRNFWNGVQGLNWSDFNLVIHNVPEINLNPLGIQLTDKTFSINGISNQFGDSNKQMMLSLVACTNAWTKANTGRLAWDANMCLFDLVRSTLHGGGTWAPQIDFMNELNSAPCQGPGATMPNDPTPWHSPSRWWKPDGSWMTGEFNGIDYMLLYNLYMLEFGNAIPSVTYQNVSCPCSPSASKLAVYINPNTNFLTSSVALSRKFPEYLNFDISVPEFLTSDLTLKTPHSLTLNTELILCNNKTLKAWSPNCLTLGTPSGITGETGVLRIRNGSQFLMEGTAEVLLHPHSSIIIEKGGTFILRGQAKLIVNDHARVIIEPGANLIWENGTQLIMQGENSLFDVRSAPVVNIQAQEIFHVTKGNALKGGQVLFHDGIFNLRTNGIVKLEDAQLIFMDQAQFNYEANGDIQLPGNHAMLGLRSGVHLDHHATLTYSSTGAPSGYLQFGNMVMTAGNNCQVILSGQGKSDITLELVGAAVIADNLTAFKLIDGTLSGNFSVNGQTGGSIYTGCGLVVISNCILKNYDILSFYGQRVSVTFSDFISSSIGLSDCYAGGDKYTPTLSNCTFTNCSIPVFTAGLGVNFYNTTFTDNPGGGWQGINNAFASSIGNCNFTDNDLTWLGLHLDYNAPSLATVNINKSEFSNTLQTGVVAINGSGGVLNIKCSLIKGNKLQTGMASSSTGVGLYNNARLNMSTDFGTGYNNFSENSAVAALYDSYAEINNGNNNFEIPQTSVGCYLHGACHPYFYGSVSGLSCTGNQQNLFADNNFWGSGSSSLFIPGPGAFALEVSPALSCSDQVIYDDTSPISAQACPVTFPGASSVSKNPFISGVQVSTIHTQRFANVKLHTAVTGCMAQMDTLVTEGFKKATEGLIEILRYTIPSPTAEDRYISDIAYSKLMESLSQSVYYKQIPDSLTTEFLNVLDIQSKKITQTTGDEKLFYSLDRAAVYRLARHLPEAIAILTDATSWVSQEKESYLNEWICYYTTEQQLLTGQITRMDFISAIRLCHSNNPLKLTENSPFITDAINVEKKLITVFPNPNDGLFTIKAISGFLTEVVLTNSLGQAVYHRTSQGNKEVELLLHKLPKGIYVLKAKTGDGQHQIEKIVLE